MSRAPRHDRAVDADAGLVVEPARGSADYWPAYDPATGSLQLRRRVRPEVDPGGYVVVWRCFVGPDAARRTFEWMSDQPGEWVLWGRLATLFGEEVVRAKVVDDAERAAERAAAEAEEARLEREEQDRLHGQIDLFILDPKNKRPGLSLESGDEDEPFFVMRFSERWERERVLDWLRWQKGRFIEFRDLLEAEGSVALERAIIAGMRETEREAKARGIVSGGRRPLRFWRGE